MEDDDVQLHPAGPHSAVPRTPEVPAFRPPETPFSDVPRTPEGVPYVEEDREPLEMLFDAEGFPVILFDPVPLLRRRRKGWDENRQRAFIAMLARVPSPTRAAKMVGMSARSAYALLDKPGAESFAKAWEAPRAAMPGA